MIKFLRDLWDIIKFAFFNMDDSKEEVKEPVDLDVPHETPKEEVKQPRPNYIRLWALAIQEFEGFYPGSASFRRNNPGNVKGLDGKFKVFKTYEDGFSYLENYLRRACSGQHKAYKPEMTLRQFVSVYAPDGDKIIDNYSLHIANKLNVFPSVKIQDLI